MTERHTPGPWQFYADLPSVEPNWHIITNASRMRVLANVHIEPGNEMDVANAKLLTAAPELLAALEWIVRVAVDHAGREGDPDTWRFPVGSPEMGDPDLIDQARRAIAKATA